MDPSVSKTLLALFNTLPGGQNIADKFPLVFEPSLTSTSGNPSQVNVAASPGAHVNLGNLASTSTDVSKTRSTSESISIPIKVINPVRKRDCKSYMLNLEVEKMCELRALREAILEQLGKEVVSFSLKFDVGYFRGSQRICFTNTDITSELQQLKKGGKCLWCEGKQPGCEEPICLDSDSEDELPLKKRKVEKDISALEAKTMRVDALANELREQHKDKYNKVQYKLWAEALDCKKHKSRDRPPNGTVWSHDLSEKSKGGKKTGNSVDVMKSAFTNMANSIASALSSPSTPPDEAQRVADMPSKSSVISPGRRIDYQDRLFKQLEMVHSMFDRGALTTQQFEKRRDSLLAQIDSLE